MYILMGIAFAFIFLKGKIEFTLSQHSTMLLRNYPLRSIISNSICLIVGMLFGIEGKKFYNKAITNTKIQKIQKILIGGMLGFFSGVYLAAIPLGIIFNKLINSEPTSDERVRLITVILCGFPVIASSIICGIVGIFIGIPWAIKSPIFDTQNHT